ncbi:MAG: hypothetical protein C0406_07720 [Sideroxydans sp.]|nr:hypothetical protein [Sideroxydans sp.]
MQRITTKIAFLFAAFIATAAQAQDGQLYLGLDAVMPYGATWKVGSAADEKLSAGTPIKPTLGYTFNDRWAIEVSGFSAKASKGSVSESLTVVPVNLVYAVPFSNQTSLLLKGGLAPFDAKFKSPGFDTSDFLIGLSLGFGLKHQFTESIGLEGGINYLNGYRVKFSNGNRYDLSPANAYLGLRFGF